MKILPEKQYEFLEKYTAVYFLHIFRQVILRLPVLMHHHIMNPCTDAASCVILHDSLVLHLLQLWQAVLIFPEKVQMNVVLHHFLQEIPDQSFIFPLQLVLILRIEFQISQLADPLGLFSPQIAVTDLPEYIFLRDLLPAEIIIRALYKHSFLDLLSGSLGYIITENIHPLSHKCPGEQHLQQYLFT